MKVVHRIIGQTPNGSLLVAQQHILLAENYVMSYGNNLCMWGMQLMHMNDMAKEEDIRRTYYNKYYNHDFISLFLE